MNNEQKRKIILIISAVIVGILGGLGFYKANEIVFEGIIDDVARNGLLKLNVGNQEKYYNIKELEYIF